MEYFVDCRTRKSHRQATSVTLSADADLLANRLWEETHVTAQSESCSVLSLFLLGYPVSQILLILEQQNKFSREFYIEKGLLGKSFIPR